MFDFLKRKPLERKTESVQPAVPEPVEASWTVTMTEPLEEPEQINPEPEIIEAPGAQVFSSPEFGSVRVVMQDNEPWFVAADVCKALDVGNTSAAIARLDDDEHAIISIKGISRGNDSANIVSESGLYSLALGSRKPEAKAFKRWITHEVIPTLRKHGAYMTAQTIDSIIADPSNFMKLVSALNDERMNSQRLTAENQKLLTANTQLEWENDALYQENNGLSQKVEQDAPKVAFAESFKNAEGSITINELAKLLTDRGYETGEKRLYETLRQEGYLIKDGKDRNLPTQRANTMSVPIFTLKTSSYLDGGGMMHPTRTTYVTPAGQTYFFRHFCGESYRVSDPLTQEELEQRHKRNTETFRANAKAARAAVNEKARNLGETVSRALDGVPRDRTVWVRVDGAVSALPCLKDVTPSIAGKALSYAGVVSRKTKGHMVYALPTALFPESHPESKSDGAVQEKKPAIITMNDLKAAISEIIADGEKRGEKRQLMTVEAFKWAHEELKDLSSAKLEQAMVNAGLRAEKVDGVRMYKVF